MRLTRGLPHSDQRAGVRAHELGHLDTLAGPLTEALNRLALLPPARTGGDREPEPEPVYLEPTPGRQLARLLFAPLRIGVSLAFFLAAGRLGQLVLGPVWAGHWRRREYAADDHAAALGQADELADFLELHALFFDLPVPFAWLAERSHPPVELRLARLRGSAEEVAAGAQAVVVEQAHPDHVAP